MLTCNAYLKKNNGEISADRAEAKTVDCGSGVFAVYANGLSDMPLDAEHGMGIQIELDGEINGYMASDRYCEFWCRPYFGTDLKTVPEETQAFVYAKKSGGFGVILPVVSEEYKCVLIGTEQGLEAKLFSWYDRLLTCRGLAFLYAEGEDPFVLMEQCAKQGLKLLGRGVRSRSERRYPELFEYLGWCTWDAMQIRVNEAGILEKCREFKEKNIPVRWAVIDDMWAEVKEFYGASYSDFADMVSLMHRSSLYSFEADSVRFPNGLKSCLDKMKELGVIPGIWHPTTGYWRGLDKNGPAYRTVKDCLIETEDGRFIHDYKTEKAYLFYKTFHQFLRECGAEFVKIDNQSMTRRYYKGLAPVGEVSRAFHDGMEASVGQYFDNNMINCMGMASEDMWNRQVSPISRTSDDFLPENRAWFTSHILQCSFNSCVQGQFYYCDWDMWWTDDSQAVKNSVLRAISGGPIYVSDMLGRSRREVLMPLCLNDGRILRCDRPAMPAQDCLIENPQVSGKIFKVQNTCGDAGVIAAFNLDGENRAVCGIISPKDIWGLEGEEFALYEHFSGAFEILKKDESIEINLSDHDDFRLFVVVPLKDGFAPIGRTDKFISPKTVKYVHNKEIVLAEPGPYAYVEDRKLVRR